MAVFHRVSKEVSSNLYVEVENKLSDTDSEVKEAACDAFYLASVNANVEDDEVEIENGINNFHVQAYKGVVLKSKD